MPLSTRIPPLEMESGHDFLSLFEETFTCSDFTKEIQIEESPTNTTVLGGPFFTLCSPAKEVEIGMTSLNSPATSSVVLTSSTDQSSQVEFVMSPVIGRNETISLASMSSPSSSSSSDILTAEKLTSPFGSPSGSVVSPEVSENLVSGDEESPVLTNGDGKKSKGKENASKALKFPPCSVCGGKASGLHYGINSCEACKGFFRRYLLRNEDYKCSKGGKCAITSRHRGNCSGCRLAKCLSLGMSKDASRLGRYTLSRRTKTILDVKELESKEKAHDTLDNEMARLEELETLTHSVAEKEKSYTVHPGDEIFQKKIKTVPTIPLKEIQEKNYIHNLIKTLVKAMHAIKPFGEIATVKDIKDKIKAHYEKYKVKVELFGRLKAIPDDEYYSFLKNYGIDLDGRWAVLKRSKHELEGVVERYVHFAKQVPGFASLSVNDQANLLKVARCDFFMILMHKGYVHECQVFLTHNGMPYHVEEAADKFFSRELIIGICEMYYRWQQLDLNHEEMCLLIAISLTFPDRCKLEHREQVEKIQYTMTELLNKSLVKRNPLNARRRFARMIDLFVKMRDCSERYYKEYKKLCDNELIIEEVPMMMELLLEDY